MECVFQQPEVHGDAGERGFGNILDYGARFFDPLIGRFISADTIVPGAGNPQAFNRYSYVLGNPLKFRDPTGHNADCTAMDGDCHEQVRIEKRDEYFRNYDRGCRDGSITANCGYHDPKFVLESTALLLGGAAAPELLASIPKAFTAGSIADLGFQFSARMYASNGDFDWSVSTLDLDNAAKAGAANMVSGASMGSTMKLIDPLTKIGKAATIIYGAVKAGITSYIAGAVLDKISSTDSFSNNSASVLASPVSPAVNTIGVGDFGSNLIARAFQESLDQGTYIKGLTVEYQQYQASKTR